jgi:hypothetical protein
MDNELEIDDPHSSNNIAVKHAHSRIVASLAANIDILFNINFPDRVRKLAAV